VGHWLRSLPYVRAAPGGAIVPFHARHLHLVMGPAVGHPPVRFRVRLDGEAPGAGLEAFVFTFG
jgi:hypothetical protein